MASRLEIKEGKFPVTPQLVFGLLFGFGVFNQILLGLLALALGREGRGGPEALFLMISAGLGGVLYLAALTWQMRARWLGASDGFVFAFCSGPVAAGAALAWLDRGGLGALLGTGANLLLGLWQARGFARRWWARH